MKQKFNIGIILLLICAFIWGTTFVAQSLGSDYVGPFTYNALRFLVAGIVLLIVTLIRKLISKKSKKELLLVDKKEKSTKLVVLLIIGVGVALFFGATLQQVGIEMTKSAAKSGFISSVYIVIVPLISLMFGKKVRPILFLFVFIALVGSLLIAINKDFKFEIGDLITLSCAACFAFQISFIDIVNPHVDSIFLNAIQFIISGTLSLIVALVFEKDTMEMIIKASPAILYAALFSGCIAYTFQIMGQKTTDATVASLIMSLESIFALISGLIVMKEDLPLQAYIGSLLVFIAIILSQIRFKRVKKTA